MERNSRKLIELLEQDGWIRIRARGSHWQLKHRDRPGRVTVPHPDQGHPGGYGCVDLPAGWVEIASGGMNYIAFVHSDDAGYGISFPDFPGCISVGATKEDAIRHGAQALAFHIDGLVEDGLPVPRPRSAKDIEADSDLTARREGAVLASVPLVPEHTIPVESDVARLVHGLNTATSNQ